MLKYIVGILFIWVIVYIFITKSIVIKRRVKLFLRMRFDDVDEKLWSVLVSLWYDFFPFLCLLFIPRDALQLLFPVAGYNFAVLILYGILGFFASLAITSVSLDLAHFSFKLTYEQMTGVTWMEQTKKISNFFGVFAAITEEFFLRYLVPFLIFWRTGDKRTLLLGLIISSIVFAILQIIYVTEKMQFFVMSIASVSISVTAIVLIFATSHILPALFMHATYVFFFLSGERHTRGAVTAH